MNRVRIRQATRDLAEWLITFEASATDVLDEDRSATCRACERMRRPLSHLTGPAGFRSLLTRALTLAQRDAPALNAVRVTDSGALEGLLGEAALASATLVAHLIELLTTFIGETLTLRLLHDIWPDLPVPTSELLRKDMM